MERGVAASVSRVRIGASRQEKLNHVFWLVGDHGVMQGCPASVVACLRVRARVKQCLKDAPGRVHCGRMQRRQPKTVSDIDVRASSDQQIDDGGIYLMCDEMKWSFTHLASWRVWIRARPQEVYCRILVGMPVSHQQM